MIVKTEQNELAPMVSDQSVLKQLDVDVTPKEKSTLTNSVFNKTTDKVDLRAVS